MLGAWAGQLWVRLVWSGAILSAFLISLFLPVAYDGTGEDLGIPGLFIGALGWLGLLKGQFGWCANFGILIAIVLLLIGRRVQLWLALLCAVPTTLCWFSAMTWREVPKSEQWFTVTAFGSGYWLWMATVAVSVCGMLAMVRPPIRPASR